MRRLQKWFSRSNPFTRMFAVIMVAAVAVCLLSLPAAAKNTYRITDGDRVLIVSSDATDPADVLNEAGLKLGKDDTYTTQESGEYSEILVQRVQMVTIDNGGQILKTGTYGESLHQLLDRLHISVGANDVISPSLKTQTYDGMEVSISRRSIATETYSKTVPFKTTYVYDPALPAGEKMILTAGSDGEMRIVEEVVYINNRETSRVQISSQVVKDPVTEVISTGTAVPQDQDSRLTIGDGIITTENGEMYTYTEVDVMKATAYTCEGWSCDGVTATGTTARVGAIAVDPRVIPYGTRMFIVSSDGQFVYGVATAEDCGDLDYISGNRIDLYFNTVEECVAFGARDCQVYILG